VPWRGDAVLMIVFVVIQLGYSYWISVASLMGIVAMIRLREQLSIGFRTYPWVIFIPLLMAAPLFVGYSNDLTQDILRTAREALIACLMIWTIAGSTRRPPTVNVIRLSQVLMCIIVFLLVLTTIQYVALSRGIYIGFPKEFYASGRGTIPGELDLRYSALRPAGTFSEPSYLAFIALSVMLVISGRIDRERKGIALAALATITGLLSQSASFILFVGITGGAFVVRTLRGANKLLVLILLAVAAVVAFGVVVLVLDVELGVLERVQGGASGNDVSIFVRIFGPISILPTYLAYHPVGRPMSMVSDTIQPYSMALGIEPIQYMMNSLFNLFFQYGVFGLPLAVLFLIRRDVVIALYLLSCMMFNGAFLGIDKLSVVCVMIAFYQAMRQQPDANLLDEVPYFQADTTLLQRGVTAGAGDADVSNDGGHDGRSWAERRQDRRTRDML